MLSIFLLYTLNSMLRIHQWYDLTRTMLFPHNTIVKHQEFKGCARIIFTQSHAAMWRRQIHLQALVLDLKVAEVFTVVVQTGMLTSYCFIFNLPLFVVMVYVKSGVRSKPPLRVFRWRCLMECCTLEVRICVHCALIRYLNVYLLWIVFVSACLIDWQLQLSVNQIYIIHGCRKRGGRGTRPPQSKNQRGTSP